MLKVIDFIKEHENWRTILTEKPYCLSIKDEDEFTLLKYNQIESDFNNEIVRECRGLIIDNNIKPVCVPFFKFGNYGEGYTPEIDWESVSVQEKVDGSLIKVWNYNDSWRVSTNGTINAYHCDIGQVDALKINCPFKTFGELFDRALSNSGLELNTLNKNYTYMFELVSPYNKVVIPYNEIAIYHIGTRDNTTLEELDIDIGVKKPKRYPLKSLQDCISATEKMGYDEEGYVVVDKNWNRVKIKSPSYVAVHHLKNNGDVNIASIVQLIRENEISEFLTYFPEYTTVVDTIQLKINEIIENLKIGVKEVSLNTYETQKDFALAVKDRKMSAFYFQWRKKPQLTPAQWFWNHDNNKIKEMIKWQN